MSKKAKKLKAAENAAKAAEEAARLAAEAAAKAAKPVVPPKPPGRKSLLIAAKREKAGKKTERKVFTREKPVERPEIANTPTAWADQEKTLSVTKSIMGKLMTGQIAPKFKPTIGLQGANDLGA